MGLGVSQTEGAPHIGTSLDPNKHIRLVEGTASSHGPCQSARNNTIPRQQQGIQTFEGLCQD